MFSWKGNTMDKVFKRNAETKYSHDLVIGDALVVHVNRGETIEDALARTVKDHIIGREVECDHGACSVGTCAPKPEPSTFGFSMALMHVTQGKRIARTGWNGKDQYVTLIPAGNAMYQGHDMQDCLGIKNAQGQMQPGWLPSQGDIFAEDWYVVE